MRVSRWRGGRGGAVQPGFRFAACGLRSPLVAALLAPGCAFACDGVVAGSLVAGVIAAALTFTCVVAPVWGAKQAWKWAARGAPQFGVFSVSSGILALVLAAVGAFLVPQFRALFASFGADLPASALIVMQYNYLLLMPGIVLVLMAYRLRSVPGRERFFVAFLAGESALLCLTLWALYSPVVKMC